MPTSVVIANTKGFTGHPMGVGIEDVVAIKALETGIVPPVPNFKEVDPALGHLNLSIGGAYPVQYALRLAAGFGSQISMVLLRWTPVPDGHHRHPSELGYSYRIIDPASWHRWLATTTGIDDAHLEVVQRRLRVTDTGPDRRDVPVAGGQLSRSIARCREPEPVPRRPEPEPVPRRRDVEADILALVADKTGYPADMLALDLDLEADLGIDTVKQAEVFATIREHYGIERDDQLKLRDYPTLAHVIGFVRDRTPTTTTTDARDRQRPSPKPAPAAPAAAPRPSPTRRRADILALVADKTGYPADMLALDLDLEADLGIDTVKQAEVFATIRERYGIERDDHSNSATTPPSPTSSASSTTAPPPPRPPRPRPRRPRPQRPRPPRPRPQRPRPQRPRPAGSGNRRACAVDRG